MSCGLSSTSPVWGKSLNQGSFDEIDDSLERENDPYISLKVDNNMIKLVARDYITEVVILALISFFYITMGTYLIHMVF